MDQQQSFSLSVVTDNLVRAYVFGRDLFDLTIVTGLWDGNDFKERWNTGFAA